MHAFFGGIQRQSSELLANFSWQKESRFFWSKFGFSKFVGVSVGLIASEGVCGMHASFGGIQRQSTELLANFWEVSIFLIEIEFFRSL